MNVNFNLTNKGKGLVLSGLMLFGTILPMVAQEAAAGAPESDTTNTSVISTPKTTISYNIAPSEDYGYLMETIWWTNMGGVDKEIDRRFERDGEGKRGRSLLVALGGVISATSSPAHRKYLQIDLDMITKLWRQGNIGNIEAYDGALSPNGLSIIRLRVVDVNGVPITEYYQDVPENTEFTDVRSRAIHEYIQEALTARQQ